MKGFKKSLFLILALAVVAMVCFSSCKQVGEFIAKNIGSADVVIINYVEGKDFYAIKLQADDSDIIDKTATIEEGLAYGKSYTFNNVPVGNYKVYVKTNPSDVYKLTNDGARLVVSDETRSIERTVKKVASEASTIRVVNNRTTRTLNCIRYQSTDAASAVYTDIEIDVGPGKSATYPIEEGTFTVKLGIKNSSGDIEVLKTQKMTFTQGSTTTITLEL